MNKNKLTKEKLLEKEHYNKTASKIKNVKYKEKRHHLALELPDEFCKSIITKICKDKILLDYGCGLGFESVYFAKRGARVIAIDISEKSLEVAKKLAKQESVSKRISFKIMDGENLKIKNNSIDIIYNRGTLSCVNLNLALKEWARILKPDGIVIGRDTLGHNIFFNLNRKIKYLKTFNLYFKKTKFRFFNLTNILPFPLTISNFLQKIDNALANTFLKKYYFKLVFIPSNPVKKN